MPPSGPAVVQWASSASASSEYSAADWSANQATGASDVAPACESNALAWSPSSDGTDPEWLLVGFSVPVFATSIEIFETEQTPF
eukprot:6584394-Prymnesium_polylepis.1